MHSGYYREVPIMFLVQDPRCTEGVGKRYGFAFDVMEAMEQAL